METFNRFLIGTHPISVPFLLSLLFIDSRCAINGAITNDPSVLMVVKIISIDYLRVFTVALKILSLIL